MPHLQGYFLCRCGFFYFSLDKSPKQDYNIYLSDYGLRGAMLMNIKSYIKQLDEQMKEYDSIYHDFAVKYGLSDTAMWILYLISDESECCTQQGLCRQCHFPKQTINTALNSLVKNGYAELEPISGARNSKRIIITESGRRFAETTTDKLKRAEDRAYSRFSDDELNAYLDMTARLNQYIREEIKNERNK